MKRNLIEQRVIAEAEYILENKCTVRDAAKEFGVCKSTISKDMSLVLPDLSSRSASEVRNLFDEHIAVRASHGGQALAKKFASGWRRETK
jgi:putative DeoR family transcriptional regulator (stage III sporulation protein D)